MNHSTVTFQLEKEPSNEEKEFCATLMSSSEPWITLKRTKEDVLKILLDSEIDIHTIRLNQELIGFALLKMTGAFKGYIQSIVIDSDYRGKGYGEKFMTYLEQYIFKLYPNVFICASSFNPRAQKLYESMGYELIGELKDYIIKGESEILMRKTIASLNEFN
jgi:[ribosomal protein S18]-alanine N-acetyltransferase